MYMSLERSGLKTSEKIARKTLKNYNPHVMVADLNKYKSLLDSKMKFIDKSTSIILKSTCFPYFE